MMRIKKGMSFSRLTASLILAFSLSAPAEAEVTGNPAAPATIADSTEVLRQLEHELQSFVDRQERLPGQNKHISVRITPDPKTGVIWVDLGWEFLPDGQMQFDEGLGEKVREITDELYNYLTGTIEFNSIRARIGGKTLNELFPPQYLKDRIKKQNVPATPRATGVVVLNPGHGKYLHHSDSTWRFQRPEPYAGTTDVYEDVISSAYSSMLATWLISRSGLADSSVKHTRDIGNFAIEPNSELMWGSLAARYYIKHLLPDEGATIWNLYPNGTSAKRINLREYDEDLMARPKYANHLNADTLISIHTDAAAPTARGTTIVSNLDNADSMQLSKNILCYMREQITALPDYSNYVIRSDIKDGQSYAEVREAAMATALVEVGFHTNTEDAAALQNSAFRSAAMRGIEKGYRTFKKGETDCRPLTITAAPAITGAHLTEIPFEVEYMGTPTYPLYLRTAIVTCPSGYSCSQYPPQFLAPSDTPGTLKGVAKCTTARPVSGRVIVVDRYLEDSDGVTSPKFRSSITCT